MLNTDQQTALQALLDFVLYSEDEQFILTGSPGTGKSFLLNQFFTQLGEELGNLEKMGIPCVVTASRVVATTNKASSIIQAEGTLHRLLYLKPKTNNKTGETKIEQSNYPNIYKTLVVIDECSMIDHQVYKYITKDLLGKGNKIIYVGDKNQLPPVNSKFSIFNKNIGFVELKQFMRFDSPDIKNLVEQLRDNINDTSRIIDIFNNLESSEHIHRVEKPEEIEAIFKGFDVNDKVLAYTNSNVNNINKFFRSLLGKSDIISEGDLVEMGSCVESFNTGCMTYTGATAVVEKVSSTGLIYDLVHLKDYGGYNTYIDTTKYDQEVKRLTAECRKKGDFTSLVFFKEHYLKLTFGYASTVHKAQGSTYNKVFIDLQDICKCTDSETMAKLFYVACSRAKSELYLYYGE